MTASRILILCLALMPAVASAQRGGGGGGGGGRVRGEKEADWNSITNGNKGGLKLSNRDVEDMSPIKLLIDKRKDLKLKDEQVDRLKELEGKLKETNAPSFSALDSLRKAAQPPMHEPSDDEQRRMMDARRGVGAVVGTIRQNYDASLKDALTMLDDGQRTAANELLEKQRKDAQETLRDKMGGGRG
jgi:hypothetical protein